MEQSKRDLTGALSSVKAEDIVKVPTGNVIEAIQGQVAGLDITRTSGEAGAGVNMSLRGTRSINGEQQSIVHNRWNGRGIRRVESERP